MIIDSFVAYVWLLSVVLISYSPKLGYTNTSCKVSWNIELAGSIYHDLINAYNHDTIQVLLTSCMNLINNFQNLLNFLESFVNLSFTRHAEWVFQQISTNHSVTAFHCQQDFNF